MGKVTVGLATTARRIRLAVFGLVSGIALVSIGGGCINQYPSDPLKRTDVLINQSEDQRQIGETWRRFWFNDQPSHMTPERIHGGIM